MRPDFYTKTVLTVIAVMLTVVTLKSFLETATANAATPHKYKVTSIPAQNAPVFAGRAIDELTADGCELVAAAGAGSELVLICRK
jgi:hypothetical protein